MSDNKKGSRAAILLSRAHDPREHPVRDVLFATFLAPPLGRRDREPKLPVQWAQYGHQRYLRRLAGIRAANPLARWARRYRRWRRLCSGYSSYFSPHRARSETRSVDIVIVCASRTPQTVSSIAPLAAKVNRSDERAARSCRNLHLRTGWQGKRLSRDHANWARLCLALADCHQLQPLLLVSGSARERPSRVSLVLPWP